MWILELRSEEGEEKEASKNETWAEGWACSAFKSGWFKVHEETGVGFVARIWMTKK